MQSCRRHAAALFAIILIIAFAGAVQGQELAFNYDVTPHTVRVCVLLVPPAYDNPNAYIFEGLRRSPYWPNGWELENPLAPVCVTDYVSDLWTEALHPAPHFDSDNNPGTTTPFDSDANYWANRGYGAVPLGTPVPKSWPQYWEVNISRIEPQQLSQFDLIYVASNDAIDAMEELTEPQLQGLVSAVEGGAVLWVDNARNGALPVPTPVRLMPPRVELPGGAAPRALSVGAAPFSFVTGAPAAFNRTRAAQDSALVQSIFDLTNTEVGNIGDLPDPPAISATNLPTDDVVGAGSAVPDTLLRPVVFGASGPCVMACHYGSGAVVATAGNVGRDCWEWLLAGWTKPGVPQHSADLKFAANILAYGKEWTQQRQAGNARGTSGAFAMGPLDIGWQYPGPNGEIAPLPPGTVIGPSVASPVVANGMVYVLTLREPVGATPWLLCFDASPERDLDGDGMADDGLTDYSDGLPYDMLWAVNLEGIVSGCTPRSSSPAVTTIPLATGGGAPVEVPVVLVSVTDVAGDDVGHLLAFNGLVDLAVLSSMVAPFDVPGNLVWGLDIPSYDFDWDGSSLSGSDGNSELVDLSTPVVHKNWVYSCQAR